jgi:16S rRNA (uracil1498-N3)-methyltransferase
VAAAQVLVADPSEPVVAAAERHHLTRVLRLQPGEAVVATDGRGRWAPCRVTGDARVLELDGPVEVEAASAPPITVAFCPVKGERPEWVVQKLTEVGVDRIVVLSSARSVVRWEAGRARVAMERLRRVAGEACAQCRRVWLPQLEGPVPAVGLADLEPPVVLAEPGATPLGPGVSAVAVGPEGGWSPEELARAPATVGLGPHVLRAETAALVAGALLVAHRAGTVGGKGC